MIDDTNTSQPGAESAPEADTGFSEAFRERAADEDGTRKTEASEQPEKPEAPAKEEVSPAAPDVEKPAEGTSAPPAKADPWDGLSPEQRERVLKLQASERSQRGRVGALTKKLNQTTAHTPAQAAAPAKEEKEGSEAPAGETKADKLARLQAAATDYPESVGPAAEVIADLRAEIEGLKASTSKQQEVTDAAEITAAYADLEEAHGDFAELAGSAEFLGWVKDQPETVVALANSWNPREVSLVLTLFKAEKASSTPPPTPAPAPADKGPSETDAKRARQLEAARDTPNRGAAVAGTPDDFNAAFKARLEKHAKEDAAT